MESTRKENGISRRRLLVGTAVLAGGALVARGSLGQEGGMVQIRVMNPEQLEGARGEELRELLQQNLLISVEGVRGEVPVMLVGVRVAKGRAQDVFVSREFAARPGQLIESAGGAYPPESFLPGDMLIPGDMWLPGDMLYPPRNLEEYAARMAMEAMRAREVPHGMFFVVVAADPRMRRSISSRGTILPTQPARR